MCYLFSRNTISFLAVYCYLSINRYHGFYLLAKRRLFPRFLSTQRTKSAFKPPLQYFATGSDSSSCQDYEEYEFVECLSEETQIIDFNYLNAVSYNHISFLETHLQLVWDLASSGFYSISRNMISRSAGYKIHFRKQPPFIRNLCPLSVWYLSFLWLYAPWQFVQGPRVFVQSNK